MKRISLILSVIVGMVAVCGCGKKIIFSPVAVQESAIASSEVYVIRDVTEFKLPDGSNPPLDWIVVLDDENIARLHKGEHTKFYVRSGEVHKLSIRRWETWWDTTDNTRIYSPGKKYYFQVGVDGVQTVAINEIDENQVRGWLERTTYRPPIQGVKQ